MYVYCYCSHCGASIAVPMGKPRLCSDCAGALNAEGTQQPAEVGVGETHRPATTEAPPEDAA